MLAPLLAALFLVLAGCIDITTNITPENASVKPMVEGRRCSYVILGLFGAGTNSIEDAMMSAEPPIQKVRVVRLNAWAYFPLPFSAICLEVVGEPAAGAQKSVAPEPVNPMNQ
jgi:hypothetical protein